MTNLLLPGAALAAARKRFGKSSLGMQALMGFVDGSAKVTGQLAGAVERATDYSKKVARKDTEPPPAKDDDSWSGVAKRTWKTLTDPQYAKKKALENTREHHRQLEPVVNRVNQEASKIRQEAEHSSGIIKTKQGAVGNAVSRATEMIPEIITAGSSTRARIANNVAGSIKDYGQHQSIPGALAKLIIPGNTKTANVASNLLGDALAEARKRKARTGG